MLGTDRCRLVYWQIHLSNVKKIDVDTEHISTLNCTSTSTCVCSMEDSRAERKMCFDKINWLTFVIGTNSVFCEVKCEVLCIISYKASDIKMWHKAAGIGEEQLGCLNDRPTDANCVGTIQDCLSITTQCICVFCVDLRTNSNYFTIQY